MRCATRLSSADFPARQLAESAVLTGTHVLLTTRDGWRLPGQVVGPDQKYSPAPNEVFVSFPQTGFTLLVPVAVLEIAPPEQAQSLNVQPP